MPVYTQQIATAKRLLAKYGQSVSVYSYSDNTPDATKPWRTSAPTSSVQTGTAAFFDYDVKHIDGELIHVGDKKVLLAAKGLTSKPTPKGEIRVGADIWKIVNVNTLSPNGEDILYTLQVRQ